jgi:hypothetical protein
MDIMKGIGERPEIAPFWNPSRPPPLVKRAGCIRLDNDLSAITFAVM